MLFTYAKKKRKKNAAAGRGLDAVTSPLRPSSDHKHHISATAFIEPFLKIHLCSYVHLIRHRLRDQCHWRNRKYLSIMWQGGADTKKNKARKRRTGRNQCTRNEARDSTRQPAGRKTLPGIPCLTLWRPVPAAKFEPRQDGRRLASSNLKHFLGISKTQVPSLHYESLISAAERRKMSAERFIFKISSTTAWLLRKSKSANNINRNFMVSCKHLTRYFSF